MQRSDCLYTFFNSRRSGPTSWPFLTALVLLFSPVFFTALQAAPDDGDCCESITLRYVNSEIGDCCFDLYIAFDEDFDCNVDKARITIQGDPVTLTVENSEWQPVISGNEATFTGVPTAGDEVYLGTACITGAEACYSLTFEYCDADSQQWVVCKDSFKLYCSIADASLCGTKYEDRNCNGIRDEGEPGIPDWTIEIHNLENNQTLSTTTDADGNYKFEDLDLAPWYVYEEQMDGWAQTAPVHGRYFVELTEGQTIENLDFGNISVCPADDRTVLTFLAGEKDNFDPDADTPAASLSPSFAEYLSGRAVTGFDDSDIDHFFAHSFTDFGMDNCCLVAACLTIHMRTNNSNLSRNDGIGFLQDGVGLYYNTISNLLGGITWQNQPGTTLKLDLGNLLTNNGTSILPSLRDGTLDFFVQDDTQVDWVELTVEYCCQSDCCEHLTPSYTNVGDEGPCCFEFNVSVAEDLGCEFDAVRMSVLSEEAVTITYNGDGSHDYTIDPNQITVNQTLEEGENGLGIYCIEGLSTVYHIAFEYFDVETQTWISCGEYLRVYCLIESGSICGNKFEDTDCDGLRDIGEPGIENWEIVIVDPVSGTVETTTTDSNGDYKFEDLEYATWIVYETQQSGWVQTSPAAGRYVVVVSSNSAVENLDFGNSPICEDPLETSVLVGEMDDFNPDPDVPAASPSDELVEFLAGRSPIVGFDNGTINRHFAHSFTDLLEELHLGGCCIVGAQLRLRVRTNNSFFSWNDAIYFVQDGQVIWSSSIGVLTGVRWTNQPGTIITIDLGNLPGGNATSIMPMLIDGSLDFYLQDDTSVDWVELVVQYCCGDHEQTVPVKEDGETSAFLLKPNPAANTISLDFNVADAGVWNFDVVNNRGEVVYSHGAVNFSAGEQSLNFDVRSLVNGAYFLRIRTADGSVQSLPFSVVR